MATSRNRFELSNFEQGTTDLGSNVEVMSQLGDLGAGAGKGGGDGGSIRSAGGALGRMAAVQEEEYIRKKEKEQLEKLKEEQICRKRNKSGYSDDKG